MAEVLTKPELNNADRNALERAARLIENKGWTQGSVARDAVGNRLDDPKDPRAACYCTLGALQAATETDGHYLKIYNAFLVANQDILDEKLVWVWNDYTAKSADEVIAAIRKVAQ